MSEPKVSFAKDVWSTLSSINVNKHTSKKGSLTYLSWAWAWGTLMDNYPESTYGFESPIVNPDGSVEVWCTVSVQDGDSALQRTMWLPVMGNKNEALINPDARKISDTRMRCLAKCLGMFGLGHYIYAGEDIPRADPTPTASDLDWIAAIKADPAVIDQITDPDYKAQIKKFMKTAQ